MKKDGVVPVTIRFPAKLHRLLRESAANGKPPMPFNREIVQRLWDSVNRPSEIAQLAERITQLEKKP